MIRNDNPKDKKMTLPTIGKFASLTRNDGREFIGLVQDVRPVKGKGTLVILDVGGKFASVYVEACKAIVNNIDPVEAEIAVAGFHNLDTDYRG
jgi:hypothetical protein